MQKTPPNGADSETSIPRLDVGLAYRTFNWQIFPSFFVAKQSFDGGSDITASGISLGAKTAFGALTFAGEIGAGQNWGNTTQKVGSNSIKSNGSLFSSANAAELNGEDADALQYWVDLGYRFTGGESSEGILAETKGAVHLVYGYSGIERGSDVDTESTMLGLSVPIDLPWIARGFRVRPEIFTFKDEDKKLLG